MNELFNEANYLKLRRGSKKAQKTTSPKAGAKPVPEADLSRLTDTIQLLLTTLSELETIGGAKRHGSDVEVPAEGLDFNESVRQYKIGLIRRALRESGGRQNKAAQLLRIKNTTLNSIIKKYNIMP